MKKFILSIALAALSFGAWACGGQGGGSCRNISAATSSAAGASVSSVGTGSASMASGAGAYNRTEASRGTGGRTGYSIVGRTANTNAKSVGETWSYSIGQTSGNATGLTYGLATQRGSADISASGGGGFHAHDYGRSYGDGHAYVNAGSSVSQGSVAGTVVWGNGYTEMFSAAGASNESNASALADVDFEKRCDIAEVVTSAGTNGWTYTVASGFAKGQAAGLAGAGSEQSGYASADAGATLGRMEYRRYRHGNHYHTYSVHVPKGGVHAVSSANTGSSAGSLVAGAFAFNGLSVQETHSGADSSARGDLEVCGNCVVVQSTKALASGYSVGLESTERRQGYGLAIGGTRGSASANGNAQSYYGGRVDRDGGQYPTAD